MVRLIFSIRLGAIALAMNAACNVHAAWAGSRNHLHAMKTP